MGVESDSRLFPRRAGEASSTLPRREEEPQVPSYAAADGFGGMEGEGLGSADRVRAREATRGT